MCVGIQYECVGHLTILLQACVGALDFIIKSSAMSEGAKETAPRPGSPEHRGTPATDNSEHEIWDATTKMLRLLLNLSMSPQLGLEAATSSDILQVSTD